MVASGSSAPASFRRSTPSPIISDQMRRPERPSNAVSVESGTAPMPSCRVAPSGIRSATCSPITVEVASASRDTGLASGTSQSMA